MTVTSGTSYIHRYGLTELPDPRSHPLQSTTPGLDESSAIVKTYDVYLVRYMLSYSASSFHPLLRPLVSLYIKRAPRRWMSHYALRIDDTSFELYRKGKVPFASTAYFKDYKDEDEHQRARECILKEKLGETKTHPDAIIRQIEEQDSAFRQKFVGTTSCLLKTPREYSLLHSNCQHLVIELIRRTGIKCDEKAIEDILLGSTRPRFYVGSLLAWISTLSSILFLVPSIAPSSVPLRVAAYMVTAICHVIIAMICLQDYSASGVRLERIRNDRRILDHSYQPIPWVAQYQRLEWIWTDYRYFGYAMTWWDRAYLARVAIFPVFLKVFAWLRQFGFWMTIKLVITTTFIYATIIVIPAWLTLTVLKATNPLAWTTIKGKRADESKRVARAYELVERWYEQLPRRQNVLRRRPFFRYIGAVYDALLTTRGKFLFDSLLGYPYLTVYLDTYIRGTRFCYFYARPCGECLKCLFLTLDDWEGTEDSVIQCVGDILDKDLKEEPVFRKDLQIAFWKFVQKLSKEADGDEEYESDADWEMTCRLIWYGTCVSLTLLVLLWLFHGVHVAF